MRLRTLILMAIAALVVSGICAFIVWPAIVAKTAAAHQRSVTASLAKWGDEYSTIRDVNEAGRALEMLEYIKHYYVVAPGYRSDPETETRLEEQRRDTIERISNALDRYIDEYGGNNVDVWRKRKSMALIGTFLETEETEMNKNEAGKTR